MSQQATLRRRAFGDRGFENKIEEKITKNIDNFPPGLQLRKSVAVRIEDIPAAVPASHPRLGQIEGPSIPAVAHL